MSVEPRKSIPEHRYEIQGGVFRVIRPNAIQRGGGRRGSVKEMSPQSRARMIERVLRLDWDRISDDCQCRFVTLTTPPEYWLRQDEVYKNFDLLRRSLSRCDGFLFAIWRKERGLSGMLHYHGIIFYERGFAPAPEVGGEGGGFFQSRWARALSVPDVRVESAVPNSWNHCKQYITKYAAKLGYEKVNEDARAREYLERARVASGVESGSRHYSHKTYIQTGTGSRWWYTWGLAVIVDYFAPLHYIKMSRSDIADVHRLRRLVRGLIKSRVRRGVCGRRALKYFSRGSFAGWRLWCGLDDLDLLSKMFENLFDNRRLSVV